MGCYDYQSRAVLTWLTGMRLPEKRIDRPYVMPAIISATSCSGRTSTNTCESLHGWGRSSRGSKCARASQTRAKVSHLRPISHQRKFTMAMNIARHVEKKGAADHAKPI